MNNNIFVELFRFDHKTDYLPYFKKYEITYDETLTVNDLLIDLNKKEKFSFEGVENFGVKINNLFVSVDTKVSEIVSKTSNTLVIEPVSRYRAINDLTINNDDFFSKLKLVENYLDDEQIANYASTLQLEYYSSNTLNFNKDYMGDHLFIIASDLIELNQNIKDEIINIINNKEDGIWFYTSKENRMLKSNEENKNKIETLLNEIVDIQVENTNENIEATTDIVQEFNDFNIAVYGKNEIDSLKSLVQNSNATFVNTLTNSDDLALHSDSADKTFSYKIAANILLDAKDNNADFLIVNNKKAFELFDNKQKELACAIGREIDMPIVTVSQFNSMLEGEKDIKKLGFDNHQVSVSFL
jgi:succinate dehydrogenase/fumarate reductase-like Fe-S protein/UDP-N-acetylglucosamine transferase subunit ALG13